MPDDTHWVQTRRDSALDSFADGVSAKRGERLDGLVAAAVAMAMQSRARTKRAAPRKRKRRQRTAGRAAALAAVRLHGKEHVAAAAPATD